MEPIALPFTCAYRTSLVADLRERGNEGPISDVDALVLALCQNGGVDGEWRSMWVLLKAGANVFTHTWSETNTCCWWVRVSRQWEGIGASLIWCVKFRPDGARAVTGRACTNRATSTSTPKIASLFATSKVLLCDGNIAKVGVDWGWEPCVIVSTLYVTPDDVCVCAVCAVCVVCAVLCCVYKKHTRANDGSR